MGLQNFHDYLNRKMRQKTALDYIQRFEYVRANTASLTPKNINSWLLSKKRDGVQGNSLNNLVKAVRAYCKANNLDWWSEVLYFKEEPTEKEIFSDAEIERFLQLPKLPYFHYELWDQWTMFFTILAFSGMRANEVASLTVDQIDFDSNNFILPKTKTRPRRVPIAANILRPLKSYIVDRNHFLFPTDRGSLGHVGSAGWQKHFNIRKKALGLNKAKLTTHSFRHSHATNLYENGVPLPDIMQIEGHKNYDTALKYVHLSNKSAQKSINKHSIVRKSISPDEKLKMFLEQAKESGILDDSDFEYTLKPGYIAIWQKGSKKEKIIIEST